MKKTTDCKSYETALGILGASLGSLVWKQGRHERGR